MGDDKRNEVFARFIKKQFPKATTVLCVADGKGVLARKLANKKFSVVVIENKPRFEGRGHKKIEYRKGWFTGNVKVEQDLIVAMHPDEATAEVIEAANKSKKPFAIVPCCVKGDRRFTNGVGGYSGWLNRLKSITKGYCLTGQLKMNGRNVVLYRR